MRVARLRLHQTVPRRRTRPPGRLRGRVTSRWLAPLRAVRFILRVPAHALLLLIRLYQYLVAPSLPLVFGSACGCRFAPTCSHYAAEAIRIHGAVLGVALAAIRLAKCMPLHPGGFDPVPPAPLKPRCERLVA